MKAKYMRLTVELMIACLSLISSAGLSAAVCLPPSSAAGVSNSGVTPGVGNQSGGANVNIGDNTSHPPADTAGGQVPPAAPTQVPPTSGGSIPSDQGGKTGPATGGGYDPTRDPGMGSGSGQAVDPNIGNTFQGQVPGGGGKPTVGDGGQPIAQPPGYTSPTQPPGGPTDTTTGPPVIWPTGKCPPGYHPSYDGSCRPSRGLLPPPRPDGHSSSGGSKPGTSGECPPGCHLKPDGSGQCHCGEEAGGTKPPATTTPPPAKPPTTSRPTGGAGG